MSDEPDDLELLARWRGGDAASGNALFDRYFVAVRRFFRNKVPGDVDDLIQKTFLACVEGRDRFRGDASFRRYLFGTANNILRVYYRKRSSLGDALDFEATAVVDLEPSPSQVAALGDEQRVILEALRRIPLEYQVVLELFYWEELGVAELAEIVGVPVGTIKTRLRRGRTLLEQQIGTLVDGPERLHTTLSNLDDWARALRERLQRT
ncbi:MAG: sigma-70 family RNA polymerase sigma factor [Nannocystaceae bacterium]|nr:sigma-70 family RNA polymerase sigma factor [Nannocystaceae bacterium]